MKFEMPVLGSFVSLPFGTVKELSEYALRKRLDVLPCEVLSKEKRRTNKQNRAIHAFCDQIASELNGKGYEMKVEVLSLRTMPYEMQLVKDFIWRPIQLAITKKKSTTELSTVEVDKVALYLEQMLADKFDIGVTFAQK